MLDPNPTGYARGGVVSNYTDDFVFGDEAPLKQLGVEVPLSINAYLDVKPNPQFFGLAFDRSRIARNLAGQLVYTDTPKE